MGTFQECVVCRYNDKQCFKGYSWVGPGGIFDTKWEENGKTKWGSFHANGQPLRVWHGYHMELPRG